MSEQGGAVVLFQPPPPPLPRPTTGPASSYVPRSIEDQIRLAYWTPSPHAYSPTYDPTHFDKKPGGKISEAVLPSPLDAPARTSADTPGPGAYALPPDFPLPEGGRVNRDPPIQKLKIDHILYPTPGPVAYNPENPAATCGKKQLPFSKEKKVPLFIQNEERRARCIPAPGDYDVDRAHDAYLPFLPEGGRICQGEKPESYFDAVTKLSKGVPGPGSYQPSDSAWRKPIGVGVWRFESETLAQSRKLVEDATGASSGPPGPGAYSLPEEKPVRIPSLKGRKLPHAMPRPYNYNCMPDLCQKFKSFVPLREQNSGDAIFGGPRQLRRSASSSAAVSGAATPAAEAAPPSADSGEEVRWEAGSFGRAAELAQARRRLPRAMSAGRTRPPLHEVVGEVAKTYPQLHGHGAKTKRAAPKPEVLPMKSEKAQHVSTEVGSEDYERFSAGKWRLEAVSEGLQSITEAACEPLDLEELRRSAQRELGRAERARRR